MAFDFIQFPVCLPRGEDTQGSRLQVRGCRLQEAGWLEIAGYQCEGGTRAPESLLRMKLPRAGSSGGRRYDRTVSLASLRGDSSLFTLYSSLIPRAQHWLDVNDGGAVDGFDRADSQPIFGNAPDRDAMHAQRVWAVGGSGRKDSGERAASV